MASKLVIMRFVEETKQPIDLRDVQECLSYFLNGANVMSQVHHTIRGESIETLHVHVMEGENLEVPAKYMGRMVYLHEHENQRDLEWDIQLNLNYTKDSISGTLTFA